MSDVIFRADSMTHAFGGRRVLHGATLWARRGAVTALLGRNGSGKSTLFAAAAGRIRADQGVVLFAGRAWPRPRLHRLARLGLFLLPERGLLPRNEQVGTALRMTAERFGTGARHDEAVDRLRIHDLLERTPVLLSGGERRRAEVAVAFARGPRVLLADEPFQGIAPLDCDLIAAALRALADDGCAIVASGHEVPTLLDVADEVVWITAGTTHGLGAPASARGNWQFRQEYLGAFDTRSGREGMT